jgi:shikimate kinase
VRSIALIGFMASGKTTVGNRLAKSLGTPVYDTDDVFRELFGHSAADWIRMHGESSFRQSELEALRTLVAISRQAMVVISTGGGIVTWAPSQNLLRTDFTVVWLRVQPQTVVARLAKEAGDRPLLQSTTDPLPFIDRVTDMLRVRSPIYEACAHHVIDVDGREPDDIVESIRAYCLSSDSTAQSPPLG